MTEKAATTMDVATLAGGCFWCVEAVFDRVEGVTESVSGYTGGDVDHPSYEQVCRGATGHAEAVQVHFDPAVIGYTELLEIFFATHDPTTIDRQGADVGSQYRSAIFYHSEAQRVAAEALVARLTAERVFEDPIVTEIVPLETFWPAEDHHQRYYARNPGQGYCRAVISPKLAKLRKAFAERLRTETR